MLSQNRYFSKSRQCATLVPSVVWHNRVTVSLFAAFSRKDTGIIPVPCWQSALLQISLHRASRYYATVNVPISWWVGMWLYRCAGQICVWNTSLPFSMTICSSRIPYSHDTGWISTSVTGDIEFRDLLVRIFHYFSRYNMIFCPNAAPGL